MRMPFTAQPPAPLNKATSVVNAILGTGPAADRARADAYTIEILDLARQYDQSVATVNPLLADADRHTAATLSAKADTLLGQFTDTTRALLTLRAAETSRAMWDTEYKLSGWTEWPATEPDPTDGPARDFDTRLNELREAPRQLAVLVESFQAHTIRNRSSSRRR